MTKRIVPLVFLLIGCGSDDAAAPGAAEVAAAMHDSIAADLAELVAASKDLQTAAPTPAGRGWSADADAAAIAQMKAAWRRTRVAYEHVEGAVAPIFPQVDFDIDARYDDQLAALAGAGDPDPFDGAGVTGMHAVERILYADTIRAEVVAFESTLPGYRAAAFPATAEQAVAFKTALLARLVDDVTDLQAQWTPANVDITAAYQGLIDLMNEQREKITKAATGEEESRYADLTLFDLENNLDGTRTIYALFQPWLRVQAGGADVDAAIGQGMTDLAAVYAGYHGDEIPQPPPTWSSENPSAEDLATPFGQLFTKVQAAVDPTSDTSIVGEMRRAGTLLGLSVN